jgi:protein FAM50
VKAGGLSFGDDEENDDVAAPSIPRARPKTQKADAGESDDSIPAVPVKRAFKPNAAVALLPKAQTKSALLREAHLKDALRKEYTQLQEAVKATEFLIPFVFYSGKNIPGGVCRVKKGDFVWLFLERARKVGAGLTGLGEHTRKDWARISVDDLMVVKGDVIIPHVSLKRVHSTLRLMSATCPKLENMLIVIITALRLPLLHRRS